MGSRGRSSSTRCAAGSNTGATSAARWGDGRKPVCPPCARWIASRGPARVVCGPLDRLGRSSICSGLDLLG
eukprot:1854364-Prymnesium_polylepis.1